MVWWRVYIVSDMDMDVDMALGLLRTDMALGLGLPVNVALHSDTEKCSYNYV